MVLEEEEILVLIKKPIIVSMDYKQECSSIMSDCPFGRLYVHKPRHCRNILSLRESNGNSFLYININTAYSRRVYYATLKLSSVMTEHKHFSELKYMVKT